MSSNDLGRHRERRGPTTARCGDISSIANGGWIWDSPESLAESSAEVARKPEARRWIKYRWVGVTKYDEQMF